uniref:cathepsin L-like isoform X1 n=2 Tax=Pristiophorus japonicus TaxID=55135 RepID=UPI00398EDD42
MESDGFSLERSVSRAPTLHTMFRLAIVCLTITCSLLQSEAITEGPYLEYEDEDGVITEGPYLEGADEDGEQMRSQFVKFKAMYNKNYEDLEEESRFNIFVENMEKAKRMQEQDRGTAVYGMNEFSDMSDEEFDGFYFNPAMSNNSVWPKEAYWTEEDGRLTNLSCPSSWDWRHHGAVTVVKNQRKCGSCWAFGAVANIESMWYIRHKKLVVLSEQELLDCDTWDHGCGGGYPYNAFNAIQKLGGMMCQRSYRYVAAKRRCQFQRTRVIAKISTYRNIRPHECEMKAWVSQVGPITITMNASVLKGYHYGIIRPHAATCSCRRLNHVALIVGYGVEKRNPYWIIKNSWGRRWGEKGYFRMYRGEQACGINRFPLTAMVR